jgi:hypothetical protein
MGGTLAVPPITTGKKYPGKAFPQLLAGSAQGNPAVVARPITWSAALIDHHVVALNAAFATIQLLLGLGTYLPSRPARATLVLALAVAAALWLAQGLGGILTGTGTDPQHRPAAGPARAALLARRPRDLTRGSLTWAARPGSPASSRP